MTDVTLNQIFLSDMTGYAALNAVYPEYSPGDSPARYGIGAKRVRPQFRLESRRSDNCAEDELAAR